MKKKQRENAVKKNLFSKVAMIGIGCLVFSFAAYAQELLPGPDITSSGMSANNRIPTTAPTSQSVPLPGATFVDDGTQNSNQASAAASTVVPDSVSPVQNTQQSVSSVQSQINSPNAFGNTDTSRTAFAQMVRNLIPLSPTQIITLRSMFDQSQKAVAEYPGVPPKPTSSSILVNMSPGAAPPVIRLRAGYVTSMVFLDSTGQPWPVVGYDLGNPKAFNIQPSAPDGKSNTLIVQALVRYEEGNLAVMLKGENTPVMITLMPGQRAVDYRVDLRMPGLGPNATVATIGLPQSADPLLMDFLDGVAPQGAKQVSVSGAPAQAWVFQNRLFLRTRVTVLSPGWIASMNSPDGTHIYELEKSPVLLASHRGQIVQLSVRGL